MKISTRTANSQTTPRQLLALGLVAAACIGVSGIAHAENVRIKGSTTASKELQAATMTKLMGMFTPATQCDAPTLVEPSTVALQPKLDKNKKPVALGRVKENWKITGCGKSRTYEVVYTLDEKKGTHIEAKALGGK